MANPELSWLTLEVPGSKKLLRAKQTGTTGHSTQHTHTYPELSPPSVPPLNGVILSVTLVSAEADW